VESVVSTADVDWLEPRGLNIVDLVGFVPEEYLQDAIVSYSPGYGIVRYQSGSRIGRTVTVTATVYPRYFVLTGGGWSASLFSCLGQPARFDQVASVAPETTLRLYHGPTNVTDEVTGYRYVPAGRSWPSANSRSYSRYLTVEVEAHPADGALDLPANMGCEMWIPNRDYGELTAVYTVQATPMISVTVAGTELFTFHSYIGGGEAGHLQPLVDQLRSRFSGRHEKFTLHIPAEADYFLLNFPAMPVDPYTGTSWDWGNPLGNVGRPAGGTYRIDGEAGLSVDHVNAMGLPLYGHWKDSDNSGGKTYLPHYKQPYRLAAPEYFVPAGVPYDPCMVQGNCSKSLLDAIHDAEMTMRVVYLRVERTSCEMGRIPLKMVGPVWSPSAAAPGRSLGGGSQPYWGGSSSRVTLSRTDTLTPRIYLPLALYRFCSHIPPDDPTGCPCGWFTTDGRMMDFIPRP
jgi:hypothetical protein